MVDIHIGHDMGFVRFLGKYFLIRDPSNLTSLKFLSIWSYDRLGNWVRASNKWSKQVCIIALVSLSRRLLLIWDLAIYLISLWSFLTSGNISAKTSALNIFLEMLISDMV